MSRTLAACAAALVFAAGCAADDGSAPSPDGTEVVAVTLEGEDVQPEAQAVDLEVGETLTLVVTSDRPGELHVHSSPAQELEFDRGETELQLTFDTPGQIDVEEHETERLLLRVTVR